MQIDVLEDILWHNIEYIVCGCGGDTVGGIQGGPGLKELYLICPVYGNYIHDWWSTWQLILIE